MKNLVVRAAFIKKVIVLRLLCLPFFTIVFQVLSACRAASFQVIILTELCQNRSRYYEILVLSPVSKTFASFALVLRPLRHLQRYVHSWISV